MVNAGDPLTEGSISPKELLAVTDPTTVQGYILKEIQKFIRVKVLTFLINMLKLLLEE